MIKFTNLKHHYKVSIWVSKVFLWFILIVCFVVGSVIGLKLLKQPKTIISPIPEEPKITITPTPTLFPEAEAEVKARKEGKILEGEATIYTDTIEGCLGCKPYYDENGKLYFIMANGERLDSKKRTVACGVGTSCEVFPLGTTVVVQNLENGMFTTAEVTDTGGFGRLYGRILDMTPAVANQINLKGKGQVRVWPL
jgi:3D (Asp-Asp-Asp) domain-containing protein